MGGVSVSFAPAVLFDQDLGEAWPDVDPQLTPFGSRVLVQIRVSKEKTRGGIELPKDTRDTITWNQQVAKVVALGPVAFKNRDTLGVWPEGTWCHVGQFIRIPKYGGDRFEVKHREGMVIFALFNDLDILGLVTGNPLDIIAFV